MSEEDDFLQTILENPDDDLPRLIWADWLEDHGDPRGDFVRVQCELARLGEDDPRRAELTARKRRLQAEHGQQWVAPLRKLGIRSVPFVVYFRRGLVEEIHMNAALFLENAEEIFHAAPLLRHLRLAGAGTLLAMLADCPHLVRLLSLDLSENPIDDGGAEALAGSTYLDRLLLFRLNDCVTTRRAEELLRDRFAGRLVMRRVRRLVSLQLWQHHHEDEEAIPERLLSYRPAQSSIISRVSGERLDRG